jgi:hypothetical protein
MMGTRLRTIRKQRCDLSLEHAAEIVGWCAAKLSRTERGLRRVTIEDFAMLVTAWGLPPKEREPILAEMASGSTNGWWDRPIPGVPEDVGTVAGYEAEAKELITVAIGAVPGLLQTYETAVEVLAAAGNSNDDIETIWIARLRRQQILAKAEYQTYVAFNALRIPWGGQEVLRGQLKHLLDCQDRGIGVRVIPPYQTDVLLLHSWHWMAFNHSPPVVYVELASGATFIHEADTYTELLSKLESVALSRDGSRKLIRDLLER